jgi:hypothetical protein
MQHAQSHHDRLRLALSKHLYPVFGDLPLSEITIKQIEDYKGARRSGVDPLWWTLSV